MPAARLGIRHYMTPQPHTIAAGQTLRAAQLLMNAAQLRCVPVIDDRKVVGTVAQHELSMLEAADAELFEVTRVRDVLREPPLVVSPEALLARVAEEMAARKLGAAVIVDGDHVLGIFTCVDALWALAEMSRSAQEPRAERQAS